MQGRAVREFIRQVLRWQLLCVAVGGTSPREGSSKTKLAHVCCRALLALPNQASQQHQAPPCLGVAGQDLLDEGAAAAGHANHENGAQAWGWVLVPSLPPHQCRVEGVCWTGRAGLGRLQQGSGAHAAGGRRQGEA